MKVKTKVKRKGGNNGEHIINYCQMECNNNMIKNLLCEFKIRRERI